MDLNTAKEAIYTSMQNDNEDIDLHIKNLKSSMQAEGVKDVSFDTSRLAQNNRSGRKMMQSYFKKRGVKISFEGA